MRSVRGFHADISRGRINTTGASVVTGLDEADSRVVLPLTI